MKYFMFMTAKHQHQIESIIAYEKLPKFYKRTLREPFQNIMKKVFGRIDLSIYLNFLIS